MISICADFIKDDCVSARASVYPGVYYKAQGLTLRLGRDLAWSKKREREREREKKTTDVAVLCLLISRAPAVIAGLSLTSWWAHHAHQIIPHTLAPGHTSSFITQSPHFRCHDYPSFFQAEQKRKKKKSRDTNCCAYFLGRNSRNRLDSTGERK